MGQHADHHHAQQARRREHVADAVRQHLDVQLFLQIMALLREALKRSVLTFGLRQRLARLLLRLHYALSNGQHAGRSHEPQVAVTRDDANRATPLVGGQLQQQLQQAVRSLLAVIEEVPADAHPECRIAAELHGVLQLGGRSLGEGFEGQQVVLSVRRRRECDILRIEDQIG